MKVYFIVCTVFFNLANLSNAEHKLPAVYGKKLPELPKNLIGTWMLEYADIPDTAITDNSDQYVFPMLKKKMVITKNTITLENKTKCDISGVYLPSEKGNEDNMSLFEIDKNFYPDFFTKKFFKKSCIKHNGEHYSFEDLKKKRKEELMHFCKIPFTKVPENFIVLSENEMYADFGDWSTCWRRVSF